MVVRLLWIESKTRVRCWTMLDVDTARQGGGEMQEMPRNLPRSFPDPGSGVHIAKREGGRPRLDRLYRRSVG